MLYLFGCIAHICSFCCFFFLSFLFISRKRNVMLIKNLYSWVRTAMRKHTFKRTYKQLERDRKNHRKIKMQQTTKSKWKWTNEKTKKIDVEIERKKREGKNHTHVHTHTHVYPKIGTEWIKYVRVSCRKTNCKILQITWSWERVRETAHDQVSESMFACAVERAHVYLVWICVYIYI